MVRAYKKGTCDYCHRHGLRVFITTFERESLGLMCDRCKAIIERKYSIREGIENCVDLWDETQPLIEMGNIDKLRTLIKEQSKKEERFIIKQSKDKRVTLYGYKKEDKFVVSFLKEKSLTGETERLWEYSHLSPASRRFNLCLEE